MKAAVFHGAGDVRIEDVAEPGDPGPGEVVLDVLKGAICGTDATEFAAGPKMAPLHHTHPASGHKGPVVLGHEFVGVVSAIGDGDTDLEVGDRVVPGCGAWCGRCQWCRAGRTNLCRDRYLIGMQRDGGLAERATVTAAMCKRVPGSCDDLSAAMAQPLAVALHGLRRALSGPGDSVVVIGVGGIGSFLVGAARHQDISPLIAIDISDARLETARALGAEHTFNVNATDHLAEQVKEITNGDGPDVVMEASGAPPAPALAASLVRPGGRIGLMGMQKEPREIDLFEMTQWEVDVIPSNAHVCDVDLPSAIELLDETDFSERVLGDVISLERLVPDGLDPLVDASAEGKIVVEVQS